MAGLSFPPSSIPSLTDAEGYLEKSPAKVWVKNTRPALLSQIEREVEAHFDCLATEASQREMRALTSAQVHERLAILGITKASYRNLSEGTVILDSVWRRT